MRSKCRLYYQPISPGEIYILVWSFFCRSFCFRLRCPGLDAVTSNQSESEDLQTMRPLNKVWKPAGVDDGRNDRSLTQPSTYIPGMRYLVKEPDLVHCPPNSNLHHLFGLWRKRRFESRNLPRNPSKYRDILLKRNLVDSERVQNFKLGGSRGI